MRIERIEIERYGLLEGRSYGPLAPGINLLCGPNEAGKSTLLSFVLGVLFGFSGAHLKQSRGNDYRRDPQDRIGGRLVLETAQGRLSVARRSSRGPGAVELALPNGAPAGPDHLDRLLGGLDQETYRNLYAFSLHELSDFNSLGSEQLQARIYSAGAGTGAMLIPELMQELEREAGELFKERGKKQPVSEALERLEGIERELEELRNQAGRWDDLQRRSEEHTARLEGLQAEESELSRRLDWRRSLRRAWEHYEAFASARHQLRELPPVPAGFPLDGEDQLKELKRTIAAQEEAATRLQRELDEIRAGFVRQEELERLAGNNGLDPVLTELERGYKSFCDAVADLPERRAAFEQQRRKLAHHLSQIGPEWGERELERFDGSVAARERAADLRRRLDQARQALSAAETGLEESRRTGESAVGPDRLALLPVLGGMAVAGIGLWLVLDGAMRVAGFGIAALGVCYGLLEWRKLAVARQETGRLRARLLEKQEQAAQAGRELEAAQAAFEELRRALGLDLGLGPETLLQVFELVASARTAREALAAESERVRRIEAGIAQYAELARGLFERLSEGRPEDSALPGAVYELLERRRKAQDYLSRQRQHEQRLAMLAARLEEERRKLDELRAVHRRLVAVASPDPLGLDAEERFLRQAQAASTRQGLLNRERESLSHLKVAAGVESRLEEFLAELEQTGVQALEEELSRLERRREGLKEESGELNRMLGDVIRQLQQLSTEQRGSGLSLERSLAVEQLDSLARDWGALTLALAVLRQATARYERERQPDVLREGQAFLARLTGGRHTGIFTPPGQRAFDVLSAGGLRLPRKNSAGAPPSSFIWHCASGWCGSSPAMGTRRRW